MTLFLLIIILILELLALAGTLVFIAIFILVFHPFQKRAAPFVITRRAIIPIVTNALELGPDSVLYDLGMGDGRVLFACAQIQPHARFIGYEYGIFPYILARIRYARLGRPANISLHKKDFFKENISEATHIYMYLIPSAVRALAQKLSHELKSGTRVLSVDFALPDRQPTKVIDLGAERHEVCAKLYVYEF